MNCKNNTKTILLLSIGLLLIPGCDNAPKSELQIPDTCNTKEKRLIQSGAYHYHATICRRKDDVIYAYHTVINCYYGSIKPLIYILFKFKSDGHDPYLLFWTWFITPS